MRTFTSLLNISETPAVTTQFNYCLVSRDLGLGRSALSGIVFCKATIQHVL